MAFDLTLDIDDWSFSCGRHQRLLFEGFFRNPLLFNGSVLARVMSMDRALMPDEPALAPVVSATFMLFADRVTTVDVPISSPGT